MSATRDRLKGFLDWLATPRNQLEAHWQTWRSPILIGAGLLIGLGTSRILGATSSSSVQLQIFLGLFVALPALTLITSFYSLWRYPERRTAVQNLTAAGLGYGCGGLLSMLLLYFSNFVGVHAFTTFPEIINNQSIPRLVTWLGAPWLVVGVQFPVEQMTAGLVNTSAKTIDASLAIAWRNFILATVFLYTVAPRALLWSALNWNWFARFLRQVDQPAGESSQPKERDLFQISWQTDDLRDYLELSTEEHRLLTSMQYLAIQQDVAAEEDVEAKRKKVQWQQDWLNSVTPIHTGPIVHDEKDIAQFIQKLRKRDYPKLRVLLFELSVFRPYFQLSDNKDVKKIKFSESAHAALVKRLSRRGGETHHDIARAVEAYKKQLQRYTARPKWAWVAMALGGAALVGALGFAAAPAIGHMIGVSHGLAGIAAKLGGLAILGGGAVSVGGLGVAGGTAVIVGGGAVLGAGGGLATVYLLPEGSKLIANDVAKFETVVLFLLQDKVENPLELIRQKLGLLAHNLNSAIIDFEQRASDEKLTAPDKAALKEAKRGHQLVIKYLDGLEQDFHSTLQKLPET